MKNNRKGQVALESLTIIILIVIAIAVFYGALSSGSSAVNILYTTRLEAQRIATIMSLCAGNVGDPCISSPNNLLGESNVIKVDYLPGKIEVVAISEDCASFENELRNSLNSKLPGAGEIDFRCDEPYKYTYCNEQNVCS